MFLGKGVVGREVGLPDASVVVNYVVVVDRVVDREAYKDGVNVFCYVIVTDC